MMVRGVDGRKIIAGIIFLGIGGFAIRASLEFPLGTPSRVGPGGIPFLLGLVLAGLGLAGIGAGLTRAAAASHSGASGLIPIVLIPLAVLVFGLLIDNGGLALSIVVTTLIATLASRVTMWWEALLLCAGLAVFGVLVFVMALGLPFRIWPVWS